jgi:hypothetical protein
MSLTTTAFTSRKVIKSGSTGLVIFFVFLFFFKTISTFFKNKKTEVERPNVKYGILSKIVFPQKEFTAKEFSFEFPQDKIPSFDDKAKVYAVYRSNKSFLALEIEKEMANKMGFVKEPLQINNNIYEFENDYNQKLRSNIFDGSFTLTYPYQNDELMLAETNAPEEEKAMGKLESFLGNAERWRDDFDVEESKITFLKYEGNNLTEVSGLSEANFTKVDLTRKKVDNNFKIVSVDPNQSAVSALLSSSTTRGRDIIDLKYRYTEIQRESFATYPIIDANNAIAQLKAGNYWPANDIGPANIIIRRMYLAYFEPASLTNFMQPIFVFEGDGGFVAYIEAIEEMEDESTK